MSGAMGAATGPRLFVAPQQRHDDGFLLTEKQWHYLTKVMRLDRGATVLLLDGQGGVWRTVMGEARRVNIEEAVVLGSPLPLVLTLYAALPKGQAFDEVVRCVTELGVTRIQPVLSARTLLQPSGQRLDRWRRIALEATEQSERLALPTIADPLPWSEACTQAPEDRRFFCGERGQTVPLWSCPRGAGSVAIAVGPEGGWTVEERDLALVQGWRGVTLGPTILRAVTAAIVAVAHGMTLAPSSP